MPTELDVHFDSVLYDIRRIRRLLRRALIEIRIFGVILIILLSVILWKVW